MKEHLEQLIQTVKETQLVERLMAAKSLAERVKICKDAEASPKFQQFTDYYFTVCDELMDEQDCLVTEGEFACTKENAVAVAMILIIENIDDVDMFGDAINYFIDELKKVDGPQSQVAGNLVHFLDDKQELISDCTLEEILAAIF